MAQPALETVPAEVLEIVWQHLHGSIPDFLRCALVSRSLRQTTAERLRRLALDGKRRWPVFGELLEPGVAQLFPHWPTLDIVGIPAPKGRAEDVSEIFVCKKCREPVVSSQHILSANYHNACGKAFLVSGVHNVEGYGPRETVRYTTGNYTVQNVRCASAHCRRELGVAYLAAAEPENAYKVGTYMIGQKMVERPPCCVGKCSVLPEEMCCHCAHRGAVRSLALVEAMTSSLDPRASRHLLRVLEAEDAAGREPASRARPRLAWLPRPFALLPTCELSLVPTLPALVEERLAIVGRAAALPCAARGERPSARGDRWQTFRDLVRADAESRVQRAANALRGRGQGERLQAPEEEPQIRRLPTGRGMLRKLCIQISSVVALAGRQRLAFAQSFRRRLLGQGHAA